MSLCSAADSGDAALAEQLLLAGLAVDGIDEFGCTALHKAACKGHTAMVQLLLDAQAAVDAVDGFWDGQPCTMQHARDMQEWCSCCLKHGQLQT